MKKKGCLCLLANLFVFFTVIYTCIFIAGEYSNIEIAKELLAVKWCKKPPPKIGQQYSFPHYGFYLFLRDSSSGQAEIVGRVLYAKVLMGRYRPDDTPVLATAPDRATARRLWGHLACTENGDMKIGQGESHVIWHYWKEQPRK